MNKNAGKQRTLMLSQQGVGMIEVLITLVILSVGLMGVASLQFVSSFSNADALNRTQSILVAQQMSERLTANAVPSSTSDGFVLDNAYFDTDLYNFNNLSCANSGSDYDCFCQTHHANVPNCQIGNCSSSDNAAFDAYQISCAAVQSNPNIEIGVTCVDNNLLDNDDCSAGSRHTIQVSWPSNAWQGNDRTLNSTCNVNQTEPHDCVTIGLNL